MYIRIFFAFLLSVSSAFAQSGTTSIDTIPKELEQARITEKLGSQVGIHDIRLRNESGETVTLDQYFKRGKPVVLNIVYYECPGLCNFVLNAMVTTLKETPWTAGNQFEIVTVSMNHREGFQLASTKKASYVASYGRPEAASGWHFLTGDEAQIRKLADEVGFGFRWDAKEKQYAHSAALMVLTPEGKVSRYLYGIEYKPKDFRLALLEASSGKIGNVIDRIIMFCYRYDKDSRGYSLYLTKLMQAGAGGTVLFMGTFLGVYWQRQRRDYLDHKKESSENV